MLLGSLQRCLLFEALKSVVVDLHWHYDDDDGKELMMFGAGQVALRLLE